MRHFVFAMITTAAMSAAGLSYAQTAPSSSTHTSTASESEEESDSSAPGATLNKTISLFGAVGYGYGFGTALGVGARYQLALVPQGFLHLPHGMHDEFSLEPGLDYFHAGYTPATGVDVSYNEFTPLVGVVWNFWLTDHFVVYPKVDVGYRIFSASETIRGVTVATFVNDYFPLYFQGAVGAGYKFGPVSLRAEVGWEALRVGVALSL